MRRGVLAATAFNYGHLDAEGGLVIPVQMMIQAAMEFMILKLRLCSRELVLEAFGTTALLCAASATSCGIVGLA